MAPKCATDAQEWRTWHGSLVNTRGEKKGEKEKTDTKRNETQITFDLLERRARLKLMIQVVELKDGRIASLLRLGAHADFHLGHWLFVVRNSPRLDLWW